MKIVFYDRKGDLLKTLVFWYPQYENSGYTKQIAWYDKRE